MLYFIQACGKRIKKKKQLGPTAPLKYGQTGQTSVDLFPICSLCCFDNKVVSHAFVFSHKPSKKIGD